jgi:molybdopterin-guanine dinucleotide biosynthesis protein A
MGRAIPPGAPETPGPFRTLDRMGGGTIAAMPPVSAHPRPAQLAVPPPLYGLVLAGGRSRRMRKDKATLEYGGSPQLERAMALLEGRVERAFVSVRADQREEPTRARFPQIVDLAEDLGPVAGILAAQDRFPEVAWLVVACDLPFLDAPTLERLIRARIPGRAATAFRSPRDGLPEPLCAIYEPASGAALRTYVDAGGECPRKFLLRSPIELIDLGEGRALDNINTPEEYTGAAVTLGADAPGPGGDAGIRPRRIEVRYYALLREQAGVSAETLLTAAGTPRELYRELESHHPFSLAPELLRVAVNSDFSDWSRPLAEGDTVVFIPPVAGG